MPIRKSPKGHFIATYGGKTKTFKTRAAAEKWASQLELTRVGRGRKGRKSQTPGRGKKSITDYDYHA
jgi:hypothetical protein